MKPTLLVLAAGMGSRYGGVKQIDAVGLNDETLLDFAVYDAMQSGFGKVVFIIRKDIEKDFRERLFDRVARNFDAEYVFQEKTSLLSGAQTEKISNRKKPWGTIHAVLCAEDAIKTPFAVINADDYYGRQGFITMAEYLSKQENNGTEHAMIGYELGKTMSLNGSVSRGICLVKDGYLEKMQEHTKISYENDKIVSDFEGKKINFEPETVVSMNFFGFTKEAFVTFNEFWEKFISEKLESEKDECLLPNGANKIVELNRGKIRVFTSSEKWFGMTYPEDRALVKSELAAKIQQGYYPEQLWQK